MTTIKSYTSVEQSRKLAKILPNESADMSWVSCDDGRQKYYQAENRKIILNYEKNHWLPCWSLAALLDIMPKDKSIECSLSFGYYSGKGEYIEKWLCAFEKEGKTTDDYIIETFDGDNPIDACVDMIKRLHELNLL